MAIKFFASQTIHIFYIKGKNKFTIRQKVKISEFEGENAPHTLQPFAFEEVT